MLLPRYTIIFCLILLVSACSQETSQEKQPITPTQEKQWIAGWQESSSHFSNLRAGTATVIHNGFMYVIGGIDGRVFKKLIEYSKINGDGSLDPWQRGPDLVEERGFIDAVVYNDYLYVVGGGNGPNGHNLLRSVERAKINADGSLSPWEKEGEQTLLPRRCTKLVLIDNIIYSLGGFGGVLLDSVEYATIQSDGHLGEWRMTDNNMTIPRYVNTAKAINGNTYVLGGHDQTKGVGITNVEWASTRKEAGKQVWKVTSSLNVGRYGLSSTKHGKYLYAVGGLTGLEYLNTIEMAEIMDNGELGAWRYTTPLPEPRATFDARIYKNWIYIIGGTNEDGYFNNVLYASINDKAEIGFWGTTQQAEAYKALIESKKTVKKALPNEGTVAEIQHASMYTYVRVTSEKGGLWLAGPKTELKINDKIQFSKGVSMSQFYSKELQRSFPVILFVSKIQRVE